MVDYVDTSDVRSGALQKTAPLLVFAFTTSMLISALLLFFVQPMFAKMVLPMLGGSPGVWNTAMVFFQAVLLGGYLYAHILTKLFNFRTQIIIHGLVMTASLIFLPIAIPAGWEVPVDGTPVFWLIALFAAALGLPFFALSANAPLMQKWFSYTDHKKASDPYFLYAASNVGSLFSLLSYPVLVEPFLSATNQSSAWAVGFIVLMVCLLSSAVFAYYCRNPEAPEENIETVSELKTVLTVKDRVYWIFCAAIPSAFMLAVTSHMTSNIASTPFLWVLPLAIYLLTFIFAFSSKPVVPTSWLKLLLLPLAVTMLATSRLNFGLDAATDIVITLLGFFVMTQLCHNLLAENRPSTSRLTEFYFFMSLGGVIGGASVALLAPVLFTYTHEFALIIIASSFLMATSNKREGDFWKHTMITLAVLAITTVVISDQFTLGSLLPKAQILLGILVALLIYSLLSNVGSLRSTHITMATWILIASIFAITKSYIFTDRSFFGISRVSAKQTEHGVLHGYYNGNTIHNLQLYTSEGKKYPLSYYLPEGTFGQALDALRAQKSQINVAAIGLGAGALSCHIREGENWKFFEIDPVVRDLARNPSLFTYVNECAPNVPIVMGDARLTLRDEPAAQYDIIMIDAFSSNAIPAHLVTKEAIELYQSRLKENGFIFFHTSNRSLDVTSVVINTAEANGLSTRATYFEADPTIRFHEFATPSKAVMVGSEEALETIFRKNKAWKKVKVSPLVGEWTDDFSHVLGAYLAQSSGK
ncbi:MAG: fused MFS/spermidine synthase [Pseudomonadota bacterium]